MENQNKESFNEVKTRLDEIVEAVSDEDISLDDALCLYEEAVKLGMRATSLLEEDIDQEQVDEMVFCLESAEAASNEQEGAGLDTAELKAQVMTGTPTRIEAETNE